MPHGDQAYMGLWVATPEYFQYREYIEVAIPHLLAGHTYSVSFYVSLADTFSANAIDNLGACLSAGPLNLSSKPLPQVRNPAGNFLADSVNWTLIQGYYVANGTEDHLTLGNFYDNDQTPSVL